MRANLGLTMLFLLFVLTPAGWAATNYWTGASGSDWFNTNNWSLTNLPAAGDDVVITNAGNNMLLTNSTPYLSSLTLTNKTITFSNWDTTLSASNITIWNNGTITVANAFATNQMSNRVEIICSNLSLNVGGVININYLGFAGGTNFGVSANGYGPGAGVYTEISAADGVGSGAGHGGQGGRNRAGGAGGGTYDSISKPICPGSGGAIGNVSSSPKPGGAGGGLISIIASGTVQIFGTITANGATPPAAGYRAGGGSGGGIYIEAHDFGGDVRGLLTACGGNGGPAWSGQSGGGGGGGGRIALVYSNLIAYSAIRMSVQRGLSTSTATNSEWLTTTSPQKGTIFFSDLDLWYAHISNGVLEGITGEIVPLAGTNFTYNSFMLTNASVSLRDFSLSASNLTLEYDGGLIVWSGRVACEELNIRNNGLLLIEPGTLTDVVNLAVQSGGTGYITQEEESSITNIMIENGGTIAFAPSGRIYCAAAAIGGSMMLGAPATLICQGDLMVTNGGKLYVYSGATNSPATNYGALVQVYGDLTICSNSWIYPYSNGTNGGSPYFLLNNLFIAAGGGIDGTGKGYPGGQGTYYIDDIGYANALWTGLGPGGGGSCGSLPQYGVGGGHGGKGGWGGKGVSGGSVNDSTGFPIFSGSGGGGTFASATYPGCSGGGVVRIEVSGTVMVDGSIMANGDNVGSSYRAGGAGGAINVICQSFCGSSAGRLLAVGGTGLGQCGGGGGGRIAVWIGVSQGIRTRYLAAGNGRAVVVSTNKPDSFAGSYSVDRGTGNTNAAPYGAEPGSCFFSSTSRGPRWESDRKRSEL